MTKSIPAVAFVVFALLPSVAAAHSSGDHGIQSVGEARVVQVRRSHAPKRTAAPLPVSGEIVYPAQFGPALTAAESYWNVPFPPLCGTAEIVITPPPTPGAAGESTEPETPGVECVMDIGPWVEESRLCPLVVHEYGHWLGLEHTQNPADVMYEGGPWWATIPQCEG